jgi:POT family proton-dependent oligopeptide transporter
MQWDLFTLCTVEFLERFAFYALISIFTLFLNEQRGMDEDSAFALFANFMTLTYLAPLLGGVMADRVLGQARAVLVGTVLLGMGYALLIFQKSGMLYVPLFALIAGYGLFKPTLPAVLANRYPRGDSGREVAFVALFLAIELGAFLAPLASATAHRRFGWGGCFAASAASMALAVGVLLSGRRRQTAQLPEPAAEPPPRWSALIITCLIYAFCHLATSTFTSSVPVFTRDHVDLTLGGNFPNSIPLAWVRNSGAAFPVLLAPFALVALSQLRRRPMVPSLVAKIGMGMVLMVLPGVLLASASLGASPGQRVSVLWVIGAYLASALPNLFLVPLGIALISQLVPSRHLSTLFGCWFVLSSLSNRIVPVLTSVMSHLPAPIWYGGHSFLALCAAVLWISQVRRLEAALRSPLVEAPPSGTLQSR